MTILLTGGAGYIGSHAAVAFLQSGYDVVVADNYCNSTPIAIERVEEITGKAVKAYRVDCCKYEELQHVFAENEIDAVVHFAGLKAVGESVSKPLEYYQNNLGATLVLLQCMKEYGVKKLVFSSSATVYGEENEVPYTEAMRRGFCTNPYGWTKSMIEQILTDTAKTDTLEVVLLRYFNPVGAHESGLIGEDPQGIPNNLMPYISQVAVGRREKLTIFGNDYDTPDGTCRRDFIHVMDLAESHVKAVEFCKPGVEIFNIGTGMPYSVLDMVKAFEKASSVPIKYEFGARRAGDVQDCWAAVDKAEKLLSWKAKRGIDEMCRDTWNWQKKNPNGYNR